MKHNAIVLNGTSARTEKPIFTRVRLALLIILVLSVSVPLFPLHAESRDGTTSSKIILVAKKIILDAAKVGIEEAGTRLMGSAWPYFEAALSPVLTELKERFPGLASALNASGPNAKAEVSRVVDEMSNDPQLKHLIIDGFSNLQTGQREIVNRIGEMEAVLYRQNESIMNLQIANDKKIDRLIALVNELASQRPNAVYTEAITMFDLGGVWTMVGVEPPLPDSCQFEHGKYGISLDPIDALNATGTYKIPFPITAEQKELIFTQLTTNCPSIVDTGRKMALYGSILRLQIADNCYFTREIKISAKQMILSWIGGEGRYHHWAFIKEPPEE